MKICCAWKKEKREKGREGEKKGEN